MYIQKCIKHWRSRWVCVDFSSSTGANRPKSRECRTKARLLFFLSEKRRFLRRCNWLVNRKFIFTTSTTRAEQCSGLFLMLHKKLKLFSAPHDYENEKEREEREEILISLSLHTTLFAFPTLVLSLSIATRRKSLNSFFLASPPTERGRCICKQCHSSECARHINKPIFSSLSRTEKEV